MIVDEVGCEAGPDGKKNFIDRLDPSRWDRAKRCLVEVRDKVAEV